MGWPGTTGVIRFGIGANVRKEIAETHLAGRRMMHLHLYSNGDLVLETQVIYASLDSDGGYDDAEFFMTIGPKDLPRLVAALVTDYFSTVADMGPLWARVGTTVRKPVERTVQCVGKRRTVEFRVKGKLWRVPLARHQTRKLAFEMVRVSFERDLFRDDSDFREWLHQRSIPWGSYSYY